MKHIRQTLATVLFLATFWLSGCQTSTVPAGTETEGMKSLAPRRVDIRGSVIARHYNDGQVILEVENIPPSINSTYDRAYVLVLPTVQIVGPEGQAISIHELQQGQNVAILLRGGGQGNRVGIGVARKVWLEEFL